MQICFNAPIVVYANSWLGETSAIGETTIFTADEEGLYRISLAESVSGSGSNLVTSQVWWNSDGRGLNGNETLTINRSSPESGSPAGDSNVTVLSSGQAVFLETFLSGTISGYDLYVTIEQLQ